MKLSKVLPILAGAALTLSASGIAYAETFTLKLGHVAPETEVYAVAATKFADLVDQYTDGNVKIEVFPNGLLGGQRDLIEGLQFGSLDITLTTAAVFSSFMPKTQVIELPFMFRDREHVYKVLDGPVAEEIYAGAEDNKFKIIDTWENGFRDITNNVRPIVTPEDMKGIKIRVMENKMYIDMFKALGANPAPIARGELFSALQTKVVDAQENPVGQIYSSHFYEVQKYVSLTGHTYSPEIVVFSLASWEKLPAEYQDAIMKASAEAKKWNRETNAAEQEDFIQKLADEGMEVTRLTAEQIVPFQEKMESVWNSYADPIGMDLIEKVKNTK